MLRPRWHDALIVSAIVALLAVGIWAMWWDDVRELLHLGPGSGSAEGTAAAKPQT
jgi:hypothetical protein